MIKHLRFFMLNLLVLVCAAVMAQGEVAYKTLSFPDDNSASNGVQNYTSSWTAKIDDDSWTITNFNNNRWGSDWTYIKCGSKSAASTGSIATDNAFDEAITKVVLDVKSTTVAKITAVTLVVASDKDFQNVVTTTTGDLGKAATFSGDLTLTVAAPAKNLYYKVNVECAKSSNGVFSLNSVKYYTTTSDVSTKLSFGEGVDDATFIVRKGETFTGKTATVTPADAKGAISYESDNEAVASVDATTGAVTIGSELGKATIKATFTPEAGYMASSASYTIDYRQAADPAKVLFASGEDAFASIAEPANQYKTGDYAFVDLNGDSYTFAVNNAMVNSYNYCLQLKKVSATDETAQGKVSSPTFSKFPYGYRVTVKYLSDNGYPEIDCDNYPDKVFSDDDASGTVYMDIPYADGTFTISAGDKVTYISSIELTPLEKQTEPAYLTFPQDTYEVYTTKASEFDGVKAKLTNELGTELNLPILYTSSNEELALVDANDGTVALASTPGEVTIKAYFTGNDQYDPAEASYTIKIIEKQKAEPGFYYEESVLQASLTTGTLTAKDLWFRNPNNIAVTFTSSDEDVAEVDAEGTVTLKAVGTTVIKAAFDGDDDYLAGESQCTITVTDMRNEPNLSFAQEEYTVNIPESDAGWFKAAEPNNPYNLDLVYTSSNTDVAEAGEVAHYVKLIGEGETVITAEFAGNNYFKPGKASYKLIVTNNIVDAINGINAGGIAEDAKVFNLQGQSVNAKNLKKGVYVVGGKKVVVK